MTKTICRNQAARLQNQPYSRIFASDQGPHLGFNDFIPRSTWKVIWWYIILPIDPQSAWKKWVLYGYINILMHQDFSSWVLGGSKYVISTPERDSTGNFGDPGLLFKSSNQTWEQKRKLERLRFGTNSPTQLFTSWSFRSGNSRSKAQIYGGSWS